MQLALRPYATAGVALAAASVIAVTPAVTSQTEIQTHAVQMTALDNPIEVFTPVFDTMGSVVQSAIQTEINTPLPIVNALIGKAARDAQTLGGLANQVVQSLATIPTNLPPALQTAFQRLSVGDFNGYVAAFTPVFMGPLLTFQISYFDALNWVRAQFTMGGEVARLALLLPNSLTIGQALNLLGPINAVTNTLTELAQVAIPSGDPVKIVNVIQHGIANTSIAGLNFAANWKKSLDSSRSRIAKALNPPTTVAAAPNATTLTLPAGPETSALKEVETSSVPKEKTAPVAVAAKSAPPAKVARTDARKGVSNSVRDSAKGFGTGIKKATDGLKKAAQGLSGKKAKTASSDSDNAAK